MRHFLFLISLTLFTFAPGCNHRQQVADKPAVTIAEAQNTIANYYRASGGVSDLRSTRDRLAIFTSKVEPVRKKLKAISATDENFPKAQELLDEIKAQEEELLSTADTQILKAKAAEIQSNFRREGVYDAEVGVSGESNRTITFKSIGFNASNAESLAKTEFLRRLKEWGYRAVVFTDGKDYVRTYNLSL